MEKEGCSDNRFDIIEQAKKAIIASTNIESSPDEMKVLDSILFRCWQMGWLENYGNTLGIMMIRLPNMAPGKKESTVVFDDRGDYIPNLYPLDGEWHLTWIHRDDGDSLCDFTGVIPLAAVEQAYRFYLSMKNDKRKQASKDKRDKNRK